MVYLGFCLNIPGGHMQDICFVSSNVPTFYAVFRKCINSCVFQESENEDIMAMMVPAH